jgi:cyclomaltodextrinase / maltogenic alpha-amylase / neopullulanase
MMMVNFMKQFVVPVLFLLLAGLFAGCESDQNRETEEFEGPLVPEWALNANIYEVNIRQYTPEGTFNAFAEDIPRLHDMGVKILWLMPIHPIGEENRKGTLGSYYSIVDYTEVNPEFGTKSDFRELVEIAHDHGMRVIIDWVANHTAWDAVWTQTHPEFYVTDEDGNFYPPEDDWEDVIQLDVDNRNLWEAMIQAMEYWVRDYNIDGFRADVAYMVPTEFWIEARNRLDAIKPVFMLAEAEEPELHLAFDMSYTWDLAQTMRDVGEGSATLSDLDDALERNFNRFHRRDYRMVFTTNHDENSWKGSDPDLYGDNFENFAVFAATVWGMPLIYNGQEAGLDKQLEFFEKDQIDWNGYRYQDFYKTLLSLNTHNQALFNGEIGGDYQKLRTDSDDSIFAYQRRGHHEQVMVILNFSDDEETFTFNTGAQGEWTDVFDGTNRVVEATQTMPANSYLLLERVYMNH